MIKDVEKRRAYQRQWMAKRRAEYFNGKVAGNGCVLKLWKIGRAVMHRVANLRFPFGGPRFDPSIFRHHFAYIGGPAKLESRNGL